MSYKFKINQPHFSYGISILTILVVLFISIRCSHLKINPSSPSDNRSLDHRSPSSIEARVSEKPPGLFGNDTANFYHLSEGADIYPYEWFEALQSVEFKEKPKDWKQKITDMVTLTEPQRLPFHQQLDERYGILIDSNHQTLKGEDNSSTKTFLLSEIGLSVSWSDHHPTKSDAFFEDEAIESFTNKKFLGVNGAEQILKRTSPNPSNQANPSSNSLPTLYRDISLADQKAKSIRMVGVNCALCHTSELITKDHDRVRLDGGANLLNIRGFFKDMSKSTIAMLYKPSWLEQFLQKLHVPDYQKKAKEVHDYFMVEVGKATRQQHFKEALQNIVNGWENKRTKAIGQSVVNFFNEHDGLSKASDRAREVILKKFITYENSTFITLALAKMGLRERLFDAQNAISKTLVKLLQVTYGFDESDHLGVLVSRMNYLGTMMVGTNPTIREVPAGYGRTDAFGRISNLVLRGENPVNLTGQVSFPWIWGSKYMAMLHYNSNTNSMVLRNTGQALGLGAIVTDEHFNSTINIYNINRLEYLAHKIKYPQWTQLFKDVQNQESPFYVNPELAARGKLIYEKKCQACHESHKFVGPNEDPKENKLRYFREYPLDLVGTDKTVAYNATEEVPSKTEHGQMIPFEKAIFELVKNIKQKYYDNYAVDESEKKIIEFSELRGPEFFRDTVKGFKKEKLKDQGIILKYGDTIVGQGYKARNLSSVWATGPFLHNGSVPTLWDLLQPSKDRPKYFNVKSREFDPKKLGYKSGRDPHEKCHGTQDQDTCFSAESSPSNSNKGHEGKVKWFNDKGQEFNWDFGTEMEDADKWALIEYLKILPPVPEYDWEDRSLEDAILNQGNNTKN